MPAARSARCVPPASSGTSSISETPRSSPASPRVIGVITSDRCLIGATSIIIAVTKETKPPTVVLPSRLCHSAKAITLDSTTAASSWVSGVIVALATVDFSHSRRSRSAAPNSRASCPAWAPCSRTLRQDSAFSSTT